MIVLLDTGPLGLVTNPRASAENQRCRRWLATLLRSGVLGVHGVIAQIAQIAQIADYELRRKLLRGRKTRGIAHLDRA